jgi:hypothetical protein
MGQGPEGGLSSSGFGFQSYGEEVKKYQNLLIFGHRTLHLNCKAYEKPLSVGRLP